MKNLFKSLFLFLVFISVYSCDEETAPINITIQADRSSIIANDSDIITFTVKTDDGKDITSEAIIRVNGVAIEGNTYKSLVPGESYCKAEYKSTFSNLLSFDIKEIPAFTKNILVENYTATWCGYCPRVHDAITSALTSNNRIVPVAIHGSSDPYFFGSINTLATSFGVTGYPTAIIDRDYSWPYPEEFSGLSSALNKNAAVGLAISTEISGDNILITVKTKFAKDFTDELKLVVCLVESSLIYDQTNYYNDGRGNPISGYTHNNVLRKYGTDLFGETIPGESTVKDNEYTKSFTINAANYVKTNCKVIAFITKADKKVLNAQHILCGESIGYEELN